jgi:predicted  nucleic acid-binding Zn-ribbon protein
MTGPDADSSDLLQRAEQAQAQSKALRKQMARAAEAVAKTEQDVARVHRRLAAEGGRLAAAAREHADRAARWRRRSEPRPSAYARLTLTKAAFRSLVRVWQDPAP